MLCGVVQPLQLILYTLGGFNFSNEIAISHQNHQDMLIGMQNNAIRILYYSDSLEVPLTSMASKWYSMPNCHGRSSVWQIRQPTRTIVNITHFTVTIITIK